eukprot:GDKJ01008617.1.p1 GENE.GDKJ01008617.1~~GDKJ01008617.1.p1  ORF type:complete len:307 (-),score=46.29 GDKJ01008617.1:42-962(-)
MTPDLEHAYLSLNISGLDLTSMHILNNYKNLHTINVSHNQLRSLDWISGMHALVNIDASNNLLISIPKYQPPKLTHINLSFNQIEQVGEWTFCENLKEMSLRGNLIKEIGFGLSSNKQLEILDVSQNCITKLEDSLEGLSLRELHIAANNLFSFHGVSSLVRLELLDVQQNQISSLNGLSYENHPCLRILNIVENMFSHPQELEGLANFPRLADLLVAPSRVAEVPAYRTQMLHRLPRLRWLDNSAVEPEEVVKAGVAYGSDVEKRKQVWCSIVTVGEEPFIDRRLMTEKLIKEVELKTGILPVNH